MNRRDAFKLFVAGTVSLLGMKGLAETLRGPQPQFIGAATLTVTEAEALTEALADGFVTGEQAHWLDELSYRVQKGEYFETICTSLQNGRASVVAAEIDGEWVDTSTWPPEQIRQRLQPGKPIKRRHV